jgi:hypothetical protein
MREHPKAQSQEETISKLIQFVGLLRYYFLLNQALFDPIMGNSRLFTVHFSLF